MISMSEALRSTEIPADEVLLAAEDVARAALAEIAEAESIGELVGHEVHEAHVLSLLFDCRNPAYPGWRWAATLSRLDADAEVNVLEVQLLPGDGSLVAPEWVPWSERLAQYRQAQTNNATSESEQSLTDEVVAEEDDIEIEFDESDLDGRGLVEPYDEDELDDDELDDEGDNDELDVDEDGFADIDEHDLDLPDDDLEITDQEGDED